MGSILCYAQAVDITALTALSTLASEQSAATKKTLGALGHFLDYMATHPDAIIKYYASDMILNIHSDASYLSERGARSRAAGHFFLGSVPKDGEPIKLNGAVHVLTTILKFVSSSAAEAELGALYINAREAVYIRQILEEMGHKQPPTPIQIDNTTAGGVGNNKVQPKRTKPMDMRFHWLRRRMA